MSRREIENLIREFVLLEIEENPGRKDHDPSQFEDDSIDLQLDRSIASFDKNAKTDEGLELKKFVSDIAILSDHLADQIDLKGVLIRRVANYLIKAYDEKVAKEVIKMLETNYGLSSDSSFRKGDIDDRSVPVSSTGGPEPGGGAGG